MINMSRSKTKMPEQDPQIRNKNFDEVTTGYTEEMAIHEAMRCLKCRKHPCMTEGCPVHNHIPEFIEKVTEGEFEEAYQILKQTTTLPAVCGRVCPQYLQCEGSCVRGKKGKPVAIGALERFVSDWHRHHKDKDAPRDIKLNGYKVAVIGSGPAGITCAGDLADMGYEVTIFEKEAILGGVLAYGIPEFRLPKEILELEVYSLHSKGVHIETGKALGKDFTLDDLLETTDPEIPLAGFGDGSGAAWALVNLICAILTIVFGATATITAFRTRRKKEKVGAGGKNIVIVRKGSKFKRKYRLWKIGFFNLISAVVAVVVFILTENIWTPMRWIDKWTLLMVIILAISLTVHILTASGKKLSPEEAAKLLAVGAVGDSAADA